MERPIFPARSCREHIYGPNDQADVCDVVVGHPGPCASFTFPQTITNRDRWEEAHPDWRKEIGNSDAFIN